MKRCPSSVMTRMRLPKNPEMVGSEDLLLVSSRKAKEFSKVDSLHDDEKVHQLGP